MDVSQLIESLRSSEPDKRSDAAQQLAKLGEAARPAAVALVEACAQADGDAFEWVVASLEQLGPPSKSDVPRLAELADDDAQDVAYWAATLLGRAGKDAATAVDALAHALDTHPALAVRQRAAWALGEIGVATGPARSALQNAATASDRRLATLAGDALKRLSP
jgi:HEAT repeat protein